MLFKILQGNETNLPALLTDGYCYFLKDKHYFYVDHKNASGELVRSKLSAEYADKLRYMNGGTMVEIAPEQLALKSEVAAKADKATTLAGYGITDAYTESEINTKLAGKSDTTHNHDSAYDAKGAANTALETANSYTDTTVNNKISTHNTSEDSHTDIRGLIADITTKLNNFLDVDDTTADQLSEVLTLIENNKGTLESLTTNKVNVSDIIDNLTTSDPSKVLSAKQGVAIKTLIDALQTSKYAKPSTGIPMADLDSTIQASLAKADSAIQSLDGYATESTVTAHTGNADIHVTAANKATWDSKADGDHTHTASEVGADAAGSAAGVQSNLNTHASNTTHITASERNTWNAKQNALTFDSTPTANSTNPVTSGGIKTALDGKAATSTVTSHTGNTTVHITAAERTAWNAKLSSESDPTVPAWAKAANKPSYTAEEVGALSLEGGTVDGTVKFTNSNEGVAPGIQFAIDEDRFSAIEFYSGDYRNTISIKPDPTAIGLGYAFVIGSDGLLRFNGQDVLYMGNVADLVTPETIGAASQSQVDDLADSMLRKVELTQAEYDALTEKDPSVIYVITDEEDPNFIAEDQKGVAGGVATLDTSGKVPSTQLPSMDYVPNSNKGVANGVATLGSDGKVPTSQLPAMGGHYVGTSAPSNTNLLWINSSNNTINYYTGSAWKAIGAVFG